MLQHHTATTRGIEDVGAKCSKYHCSSAGNQSKQAPADGLH